MATRLKKVSPDLLESLPKLPLSPRHWQAIFQSLDLSPRQVEIATLMLRSAKNPQIAELLGIGEPTVKTQIERIFRRAEVGERMEFSMRVLAVSHELCNGTSCRPTG